MNSPDTSSEINQLLENFYATKLEAWKKLQAEQANRGLSIPMFVKASNEYLAAKPRIVFVGQETHGWYTDYKGDKYSLTVSEITKFYEEEWVKLHQKYHSPYWQAMSQVAGEFGLNQPPRSFLFANLFPCDLNKKQAPEPLLKVMRSWEILPYELELLSPDYVIFFCGPVYSYNLGYYFGLEVPPSSFSLQTPWQRYQPPEVKWKGFATYHPAYMQRKNISSALDEIVNAIKSDKAR